MDLDDERPDIDERSLKIGAVVVIAIGVIVMLFLWVVAANSDEQHPARKVQPQLQPAPEVQLKAIESVTSTTSTTPPMVATANMTAVRIDPPETTLPFDPVAYVNSLAYEHMNPEPAMEAFRVVATAHGWTPEAIERWAPFVYDVMIKESGFCWNVLRGPVLKDALGCTLTKQGFGDDAGFGQVTYDGWGPRGAACLDYGLCSKWEVIASPWNSMTAMLALMEDSGRFPWCWDAGARAYHNCALLGASERPLP